MILNLVIVVMCILGAALIGAGIRLVMRRAKDSDAEKSKEHTEVEIPGIGKLLLPPPVAVLAVGTVLLSIGGSLAVRASSARINLEAKPTVSVPLPTQTFSAKPSPTTTSSSPRSFHTPPSAPPSRKETFFSPSDSPSSEGNSPTYLKTPGNNITSTTVNIRLGCSLNTRSPHPGVTITMTYDMILSRPDVVGLGAAIYDDSGNDDSTGYGDIDSIQLPQGQVRESRPVPIPGNLPAGNYEIDAEIWPPNEVGQDGANTIADATCAYFTVP